MKPSNTIEWHIYNSLEFNEQEWIIDQLIPAQSTVCLYGARGLGKTFLTLDFALCVATGTPWNDLSVKKGNVAYMLAERTEGLTRRISGWSLHHGFGQEALIEIISKEKPSFKASSHIFSLDKGEDRNKVIKELEKDEISLLILDPMISYASGKENDSRDMQEIVLSAREITKELGCTVLLVHHAGKQADGFNKGARGSSALEAGMDTVIELSKQKNSSFEILRVTKQREHEAIPPMVLEFLSIEDELQRPLGKFPKHLEDSPFTHLNESKMSTEQMNRENLLKGMAILAKTEPNGSTNDDIAEIVKRPASTIWRHLNSPVAQDFVIKDTFGGKDRYRLNELAFDFLKSREEDNNND